MGEHVSELHLDALEAGLPVDPSLADHAHRCERCAQRLVVLANERRDLIGSPAYVSGLASLRATPRAPAWPRWLAFALAPVAVALVAFVVLGRTVSTERVKGAASLELQRAVGHAGPLAAGETVSLVVAPAGHAYAVVVQLDAKGLAAKAWPPGLEHSAPVTANSRSELDPPFRVTPGSFTLWAFFSDEPLSAEAAVAAAAAAWPGAPGHVEGEQARARTSVEVQVQVQGTP